MENNNPFIIEKADSDFNKALNNICNAAPKFGFNVVHIHNMKDTFERNGLEFNNDYCIVELCSPEKAHHALSMDLKLGNMMPKHIIVFKDKDLVNKYMLMKPDPIKLQRLFPDINISELSDSVFKNLEGLMRYARGNSNEL